MRKRYNQKYHKTLEEGSGRKKTAKNSRTGKGGNYSSIKKKDIQNTSSGNRTIN
jgi:hypothetical protein